MCQLIYLSYFLVAGRFKEFTILAEFNNRLVGYFLNQFVWVEIEQISFKALKYIGTLIPNYEHRSLMIIYLFHLLTMFSYQSLLITKKTK